MSKKLFADEDFRKMVRKVLERVLWYIQFDLGSKDLKEEIKRILAYMDEEDV